MDSQSSVKRRFDITMSKRTRKPFQFLQAKEKPVPAGESTVENLDQVKEGENGHKSLKQLINGDDKEKMEVGGESPGRNSLGQHFNEEEKHLQLVKRQQGSQQGLKFKKLLRGYTKVLSHLMKAKRDPHIGESGKKPMIKLPK
ncbi:hypothetical protein L6164_018058 [Bauhinia variegata]|uniref:Uncharacterized protein n=1 Tax=Bauhinia variegata TaxID=167791 RepID=A0ACB9N9T2_BAUVA|nr:hypothetical protein L6164_018058 [Bauhinia variegata]